ncbi:hypothetical protein BCY86_03290 [Pajaroellobacter abortibovis]|uniref:Uncharacterized protein n=1 Tax=Pajaroellobacter abortibovis TaxID=1882918 RepID=A0A1L6MWL5_9BACT|nr:hypothetical protein BCY86_03290 [Pajaroellobacter abortibovis]
MLQAGTPPALSIPRNRLYKDDKPLLTKFAACLLLSIKSFSTALCSSPLLAQPSEHTALPNFQREQANRLPSSSLHRSTHRSWSPKEAKLISVTHHASQQKDEMIVQSGFPTSVVASILLTLTLEYVVLEEPKGFFRFSIDMP